MPEVSIIVRTKNEERWISACLNAVFKQQYRDFEVILVDNQSEDKTVDKARQFPVKVVSINEYMPGKAINMGIRESNGKYLCCLSGHCIPKDNTWLSKLTDSIKPADIAGVYGRQEPFSFTSDFDKRDLLITFGLDRKVQIKDPFFHNANSIIKRKIWDEIPFDDKITNIEDRIWAREVLKKGYKIVYEPEASVYHHHGIHQALDPERCRKIVGIIESLNESPLNNKLDIKRLNVACIIPLKGTIQSMADRPLIDYTIRNISSSKIVKQVILAADNDDYLRYASKKDNIIVLKRPEALSNDFVELEEVLSFSLNEIEKQGIFPDIIVYLSITYPFRPPNIIDSAIELLATKGYDSVITSIAEYRSCWRQENGSLIRLDEGFIPNKFKNPLHIGISGICTVTYANFIRNGERLGKKVGVIELDNTLSTIDVGRAGNRRLAEKMADDWWKENG